MDSAVKPLKISDKIIWVCMAAFVALSEIAFGYIHDIGYAKYSLLIPIIIMGAVKFLFDRKEMNIKPNVYHLYLLLFAAFCLASYIWAIDRGTALHMGLAMFEVLVIMIVIIACLPKQNVVSGLLRSVMWGGHIIAVYVLCFYGADDIISILTTSGRISSDALNSNVLGMMSAYAILIDIYFIFKEGFKPLTILSTIFCVPTFVMLIVANSKKGIIIFVLGLFLFIAFKMVDGKRKLVSVLRIAGMILGAAVLLIILSKVPMFQGIFARFDVMINVVLGKTTDTSTTQRIQLIAIGIEIFKEHPLFGVGIDCAKIIAGPFFGMETFYLHNNYIEILANVGIIGFILYYWLYAKIFVGFIRKRNFSSAEYQIVLILFVIRLLMDIGAVFYENIPTYIFLLIFFMEAKELATNRRKGNLEENAVVKGTM